MATWAATHSACSDNFKRASQTSRERRSERMVPAEIEERYPGAVEAGPFIRASIARDLRVARELAGLTPERLAARVGKSANFIRESEAGRADVTERYILALL